MELARMRKGCSNWSAVTRVRGVPEKMIPVTKNGARVVPRELMAQTMLTRCTGCVGQLIGRYVGVDDDLQQGGRSTHEERAEEKNEVTVRDTIGAQATTGLGTQGNDLR